MSRNSILISTVLSTVLATALLCPAPAAMAQTELLPGLEISGFGTLGVVQTDSDHAQLTRDQSQYAGATNSPSFKQDSLIGLQAYFKASDSLEFVAQGVSRYGPRADFRPELLAAFGRYTASPNLSLRAGRMGVEFYMLSDSRLVGYSYLTVRPPRDVFATLAFQYVDGADLTVSTPLGDGVLKGKIFLGQSGEEAPVDEDFLDLRGNPMGGGYLDYQSGNWQWRATYAQMRFKHDLPAPVSTLRDALNQPSLMVFPDAAEAARKISLLDKTVQFSSLGAVYDRGPLQIQGMLSDIRHESAIYENTRAAYVLAGYRMGEFTPFAGYSWTRSRAKSLSSGLPDGAPFDAIKASLAGALARTHTDHRTLTLGTRWDFRRDMALKAQIDMIRGQRESIYLYPESDTEFNGKLNVFSLVLDVVF